MDTSNDCQESRGIGEAGVGPRDSKPLCAPVAKARRRRRRNRSRYSKQASKAKSDHLADPRCGTWLNEYLYLSGKQGARLLESVLLSLSHLEQCSKSKSSKTKFRARSQSQQRNFERRIDCILANVLRTHFYRETSRVTYYRKADGNRGKSEWMSAPSVASAIDLMVCSGLLIADIGVWKGTPDVWDGYTSTYWPDQNLIDLLAACNVNPYSFDKDCPDGNGLIRLRPSDGDGRDLSFEWTERVVQWANDIDRYNRFSSRFEIWIRIDVEGDKWLANWCNENRREGNREPLLKSMEFFNRFLVRIFNDGTFDHGGRLYGAWYQYVPGWLRKKISIDDDDTVELDFSCMALRMIYNQRGIDYREDAYDIPALTEYAVSRGYPPTYFRNSIKKLVQAMLNNEDEETRPEMIKLDEKFGPRFTRAQVRDLIFQKHERIANAFGTGEGKRNQRMDSDLALEIIVKLMDKGILCLPIHDSFIVAERFRDELYEQMRSSYQNALGFEPIIH